jgi:predicted ABC-type ATPase
VASKRPCLVIVGGPNGSGKSTFAGDSAGATLLLGTTAIDPDDLTRQAVEGRPGHALHSANIIAAERAEKAVWRAIAEGASVAVETVLSSNKFLPVVDAARRRHYARVWYLSRFRQSIWLSPECARG